MELHKLVKRALGPRASLLRTFARALAPAAELDVPSLQSPCVLVAAKVCLARNWMRLLGLSTHTLKI